MAKWLSSIPSPRMEAPISPSPGSSRTQGPQPVALRLELATRGIAQVLQIAAWVMMGVLVGFGIWIGAASGTQAKSLDDPRGPGFHRAALILASITLGCVLALAAVFAYRLARISKEGRVWSQRQKALVVDAVVTLALQVVISICWVTSNAVVLDSPCLFPFSTVVAIDGLRETFVVTFIFWMLIFMHSMSRYRGNDAAASASNSSEAALPQPQPNSLPGSDPAGSLEAGQQQQQQQLEKGEAVDSPPPHPHSHTQSSHFEADSSHLLVIDRPWGELLRFHAPKLIVWLVLVVFIIVMAATNAANQPRQFPMTAACAAAEGVPPLKNCSPRTGMRVVGALQLVAVVGYFIAYMIYQRIASRDHESLPYFNYRLSQLYIRVKTRYATITLAGLVLTMLVARIYSLAGSCWAFLEAQLGGIPVMLSIWTLTVATAVLFMPVDASQSVLQAWLQEFAWTSASLEEAMKRRNAHLKQIRAADPARRLVRRVSNLMLPDWVRKDRSAAAQLAREPMLCIEVALRLLYWSRLSYECETPGAIVTQECGRDLFGLQHSHVIFEPASESLALLGWGGPENPQVVLSFRGTSNMKNAVTDIKFWKTPHLPRRWHHGRLVLVHSGFYNAWRMGGFNERVLSKLEEAVAELQADESQIRFFITGHSLGGALATLAAFEVKQKWPDAQMFVYTFGAPRVGNTAWASEYDALVPGSWYFVNHQDPVPRIPKGLYKRQGQRVTINATGDMIVRPSYFELSVILRSGGTVAHHMCSTYSLSMAAILKAQFSEAKCLPGGEEGVRQLAASLDLGQVLVLENVDVDSLANPAVQPELPEALQPKKSKKRRGSLRNITGSLSRRMTGCCGDGTVGTKEDEEGMSRKGTERSEALELV